MRTEEKKAEEEKNHKKKFKYCSTFGRKNIATAATTTDVLCRTLSLSLCLVSTSYVLREQCIRVFETIFLFHVRCVAVHSSPRTHERSFVFGEQRKMDKKIALTK